MVQRRDRPAGRRKFPLCAGPLGAGLSIAGLAILALVTLAPPVPAQAADAPYDPFDRCAFYAGDPDYPEVSARNSKPVAGYLGDLSRVYGWPFDFIEVAPAIKHCEAAVALGIMEKFGAAFYCNYMESFKFLRRQMMDDPGWAAFPRFKAWVLTVLKTCSAPIQCRFYRARAADPFFRAALAASRVKKRHYCPAIAGAAQ